MHSRSRLLLLALLLVAGTLALPWAASAQEPVTSRLQMSIGGYIKPEFMYRTNAAAAGVAGNPFGVSNFGFAVVPQKNTTAGANGTMNFSANETRLGFSLTAPDWRGLKPTAYLETDFAGNDGVINGYCQSAGAATPCVNAQNAVGSPQTSDFGYGGFRLRHAFFRLAGEGLGGSWSLTAGQTWGLFGMLPYYAGSSLSFGGASVWGQRQPQFTMSHTLPFLKDFQWINTIGVESDTTFMNESPQYAGYSRLVYNGWQGWNGGVRTATNIGISAYNQREKAQLDTPAGATNGPVRALSTQTWGVTHGIFLPILPGTSATDRTWALSVVSEGGFGAGANGMIPGASPLLGGLQPGANNLATPGAVYFKPSSCSQIAGGSGAGALLGGQPGVNLVGGSVNPCTVNALNAAGGQIPAAGLGVWEPTKLSTIRSDWASYNLQFYLPWNFWLSGGQKWIWFRNADNAAAQTSILMTNGQSLLVTPAGQGQFNPLFNGGTGAATLAGQAGAGAPVCLDGECVSLNTTRDNAIKRLTYSYVVLFYDMTPNIRWGLEWGLHTTDRKNSIFNNQSERFQFGAYYFF